MRRRTARRPGAEGLDPTLRLAREWLLARGARLARTDPDVVGGRLPDGTSVRYTCSPVRARNEPQTVLLAPGSDGLETLRRAIERRGTSPALRVDAPAGRAAEQAREAFVTSPSSAIPATSTGRFVVIGAGKGVRECVVESRRDVRTLEYTVRMRVVAPSGQRDELIRVALDADTGERVQTLDEAVLRQAHAAAALDAAGDAAGAAELATEPEALARVEQLLDPPARAAARLARALALPEYQRRQDDIQALYARLFQEAPDQGAALLSARERELNRLAEARAVEVQLHTVNVATIITELARVQVHLAGGGLVTVDVDPCRARVHEPHCAVCGRAWRVGGRCAEGHVTCLDCQQVCRHCDKSQCPQCAAAAFTPCPTCGEPACEACGRSAARGRHRTPHPPLEARRSAAHAVRPLHERNPIAEPVSGPPDAALSPEDLTVADLDDMTDATWYACLRWLMEGMGYTMERALDRHTRIVALVCRRAALKTGGTESARFGDLVVVVGHRPADEPDTVFPPELIREILDLPRQMPGARGLLITTAHAGDLAEPVLAADWVAVKDRDALARSLIDACGVYGRERRAAEQLADRLAAAAQDVRAALMHAAGGAASTLDQHPVAGINETYRSERGLSTASVDTDTVEQAALTARQALAALETLVEHWEDCFAPTPDRDGALSIAAEQAMLADLGDRARHLASALKDAGTALVRAAEGDDTLVQAWRNAVIEEIRLRCLALERRAAAIDPIAWRSFSAAHHTRAEQEAVEALAASGRAGLRARRLLDELESHRRGAASPQPGARTRARH